MVAIWLLCASLANAIPVGTTGLDSRSLLAEWHDYQNVDETFGFMDGLSSILSPKDQNELLRHLSDQGPLAKSFDVHGTAQSPAYHSVLQQPQMQQSSSSVQHFVPPLLQSNRDYPTKELVTLPQQFPAYHAAAMTQFTHVPSDIATPPLSGISESSESPRSSADTGSWSEWSLDGISDSLLDLDWRQLADITSSESPPPRQSPQQDLYGSTENSEDVEFIQSPSRKRMRMDEQSSSSSQSQVTVSPHSLKQHLTPFQHSESDLDPGVAREINPNFQSNFLEQGRQFVGKANLDSGEQPGTGSTSSASLEELKIRIGKTADERAGLRKMLELQGRDDPKNKALFDKWTSARRFERKAQAVFSPSIREKIAKVFEAGSPPFVAPGRHLTWVDQDLAHVNWEQIEHFRHWFIGLRKDSYIASNRFNSISLPDGPTILWRSIRHLKIDKFVGGPKEWSGRQLGQDAIIFFAIDTTGTVPSQAAATPYLLGLALIEPKMTYFLKKRSPLFKASDYDTTLLQQMADPEGKAMRRRISTILANKALKDESPVIRID